MSCLFKVCRKSDDALINVYAVKDDKNGYPNFLIYEDNEWKYIKAKHFYEYQEFKSSLHFHPAFGLYC